MYRVMKCMLGVAAVVALAAGTAMAQGYRDAGAKAAGQFGTGFHSGAARAAPIYGVVPIYAVAPAPQVVQAPPAPLVAPPAPQVAAAPTDGRRFSVEPSEAQAIPMAPAAPQVIRSYSYQPAPAIYGTPLRARSAVPTYLLPRTDPRKHGG